MISILKPSTKGFGGVILIFLASFLLFLTTTKPVHAADAYDLSQWQSNISDAQAQKLKSEVKFVILRVQYGSSYADTVYQNNVAKLQKYGIPYGVYSFSMYTSVDDAKSEARSLYQRSPKARFFVNDAETIQTSKDQYVPATIAWANQMRSLTSKPVILYSYQSMLDNELSTAINSYDGIWLASYTATEPSPTYHYDLWQYTDKYVSNALQQNVDASIIPQGGRSFLTLKSGSKQTKVTTLSKATAKKAVAKHTIVKKVTKKTTVKKKTTSKKATLNDQYFTDTNLVFLQTTQSVKLYHQSNHKYAYSIPANRYLLVNSFVHRNGRVDALTKENLYFVASKKTLTTIKDKAVYQQLLKTLKS